MGIFESSDPEYARVYAQESVMVDASELIADAMQKAGVAPVELAGLLRSDETKVSNLLAGEHDISVRHLAEVLQLLRHRLELRSIAEQ
ncbi:hypothetical protein JOF48_001851 [Arthrobacter stackebrandtii]|uniref:XRE family transcriptional regulator n=1 Tax=Arthrobacter stackebrandtii TaxID=272161 RepID=A0ABS4YX77_9MICC|nr:hypothetical protein [Arthrobacter stackebrandtii]MBP2413052.1 hypothetical protein [Arthrobacter stackebrandtii]PYH01174.1 hypothetical protein CVV67_06180 [Arthrobacter stackebrandtii]